jgi:tetratricopeptide (TPR) repeat protein
MRAFRKKGMMPLENEFLSQGVERLKAGDYEAALNLLDQAIAENQQQPDTWYQKGLMLQKLGRYTEAVVANERFMALTETAKKVEKIPETLNRTPLFNMVQQPDLADKWLEQGYQQILSEDYKGAIASLDKVLEIKPNDYKAWNSRGYALGNLCRFEEEIASYDKALEIKPDYHVAWNNRGCALRNLNRFEEAITSYDKTLELNPDEFEAWISRGAILCDVISHHEEAITSFDKALQFKPDDYKAWVNRGNALGHLNCYEEAITSFDKALQFKPDDQKAWYGQGNTLFHLNRYEEAISSFDKVLQFKPDYHEAWVNRGVAVLYSPLWGQRSVNKTLNSTSGAILVRSSP